VITIGTPRRANTLIIETSVKGRPPEVHECHCHGASVYNMLAGAMQLLELLYLLIVYRHHRIALARDQKHGRRAVKNKNRRHVKIPVLTSVVSYFAFFFFDVQP
jgi:hypothetical protein